MRFPQGRKSKHPRCFSHRLDTPRFFPSLHRCPKI
ncbi:Uncharacterised protein [Vibrio cholerae]|nr:Uncharacterised protein [Vibrio cholerae]